MNKQTKRWGIWRTRKKRSMSEPPKMATCSHHKRLLLCYKQKKKRGFSCVTKKKKKRLLLSWKSWSSLVKICCPFPVWGPLLCPFATPKLPRFLYSYSFINYWLLYSNMKIIIKCYLFHNMIFFCVCTWCIKY